MILLFNVNKIGKRGQVRLRWKEFFSGGFEAGFVFFGPNNVRNEFICEFRMHISLCHNLDSADNRKFSMLNFSELPL